MGGGGGGDSIQCYTFTRFNMADFTDFKKTRWDGFSFSSLASFQTLGIVNRGNLLVVAKWWAGTYKSSALCRAISGLRVLLEIQVSLNEIGSFFTIEAVHKF